MGCLNRGQAYLKNGDYDSAIADLTEVIRNYPFLYGLKSGRNLGENGADEAQKRLLGRF